MNLLACLSDIFTELGNDYVLIPHTGVTWSLVPITANVGQYDIY